MCLGRFDAASEKRVQSFELIMLLFVVLDIMVVFLPNSGWRKIWHVLASFSLMCIWTLIIIPMLGAVISSTQKDPDGLSVTMMWGVWYTSCVIGAWLFISWFLEPGIQWYLCEWLFIYLQGFQVIAVGISLQSCQAGAVSYEL
jgi:energy-coupling factor transporter transmembrane protein EcfT